MDKYQKTIANNVDAINIHIMYYLTIFMIDNVLLKHFNDM